MLSLKRRESLLRDRSIGLKPMNSRAPYLVEGMGITLQATELLTDLDHKPGFQRLFHCGTLASQSFSQSAGAPRR
jgi:hypothetical protein